MQLVLSNVVVVAKSFNPSILTQLWLARNEVVGEDEFLPGCMFVEGLSQVTTQSFDMLVIPDRLQFTPKAVAGQMEQREGVLVQLEGEMIAEKIGKIIRALPHTPYTAVGINFAWQEKPGDEGVTGLTRRLFFNSESALHHEFDSDDASFGVYMSKDIGGGLRLKCDVKPVFVNAATGKEPRLHLGLNFHREVTGVDPVGEVIETIGRWAECKQQATTLVGIATGGGIA